MVVNSFLAFLILISLILPGFIWHRILTFCTKIKRRSPQLMFMDFLALGAVNFVLCLFIIVPLLKSTQELKAYLNPPQTGKAVQAAATQSSDDTSGPSFWYFIGWIAVTLILPAAFALTSVAVLQKWDWRQIARKHGIITLHPIPTAWDWVFSRKRGFWVSVTLKDKSVIIGYYGSRSFASSEEDERDLFVEWYYRPVDQGGEMVLKPVENNRGVLINKDSIKTVELYNFQDMGDTNE